MNTKSFVSTSIAVLFAAASAPFAHGAVVWGSGSGFGPHDPGTYYATFRYAAYVSHNSLTDDNSYDTMGIRADIQLNGDYWPYFADSTRDVTDDNINEEFGNGISVGIIDGYYAMQAWLHRDGNDIDYVSIAATCYEYEQDCGL